VSATFLRGASGFKTDQQDYLPWVIGQKESQKTFRPQHEQDYAQHYCEETHTASNTATGSGMA
jgi:hypothetical protein